MSSFNFDILKQNIRTQMRNNNVTQCQLATQIGMSQSNISKCLSQGDASRSFTLEQVCKIADFFHTTIDSLIGNVQTSHPAYNPKEICSLLVYLFENHMITHSELEYEDEIIDLSFLDEQEWTYKKLNTYDVFYFPSYMYPPSYATSEMKESLWDYVTSFGNEITDNMVINHFLKKYISIFEKYDVGILSKDEYDNIVTGFLKTLE